MHRILKDYLKLIRTNKDELDKYEFVRTYEDIVAYEDVISKALDHYEKYLEEKEKAD